MDNNLKYNGNNIVFLVGCPRSGTTWLQRLLSNHPRIRTGQESHIFTHYIGPCIRNWQIGLNESARGGIGLSCYITEDIFYAELKKLLNGFLNSIISPLKDDEIFLEKSPSHALYLREIMQFLPESRIIHIIRDPRDVVSSLLAAHRSWGTFWAPGTAASAINLWINHYSAVKKSKKYVKPSQFFEITYEDLLKNTSYVLNKCFDFLQLDFSIQKIKKSVDSNAFTTSQKSGGSPIALGGEIAKNKGFQEVQEPNGFLRSGQAGNWKKDLTYREKYVIWRRGRKIMEDSGYGWKFPL